MGRIFLYFPYFYGRADDIKAQVAIIFEMTAQCCTRIVGSDIMYFAIFQMTGGEYVDICSGNVGGICGNHGILSKCGVKNIDSDSATAIRTSVVAVAAWAGLFILTCGTISMAVFT